MTENLIKFYDKLKQDDELKARFESICEDPRKGNVIDLAAKCGFTLTKDDFRLPSGGEELSIEELDDVSGGDASSETCICPLCREPIKGGMMGLTWHMEYTHIF